MSRVIALTGPAGCGKSTIAAALEPCGFARIRFAAPLKAMMATLYAGFGLSPDEIAARLDGPLKERDDPVLGASPRWAMQSLGTEWGRQCIAPDLWVRAWRSAALAAIADGAPGVVVEDCRFPNEAATVRGLGGIVVELDRPGVARRAGHASEAGVEADHVIANDAAPKVVARALLARCPVLRDG